MNMTFSSLDFVSASSVVTCLSSCHTESVTRSDVTGEAEGGAAEGGAMELPLIVEISLVSDEDDNNVVPSFSTNIVDPFRSVHERSSI